MRPMTNLWILFACGLAAAGEDQEGRPGEVTRTG